MRVALVLSLLLLAGCGSEMSDAEKKAKEEADVAFVNGLQAKDPPPKPILPQTIGYPDIEQYKLFGATCAFAPGNSIGAIVVALDDTAWLKLEDHMVRLAADKGGEKLPMGTWRHYDGKEYSLELELQQRTAKTSASQTVNYPGELEVRDAYGQLVYGAKGTVQCGA
jgi:hypothetical protein